MSSRNSADLTKRTIAFAWKKFRTSKKRSIDFSRNTFSRSNKKGNSF